MKTISTLLLAFLINTTVFGQISSLTSTVKNNRIDLTWSASTESNVSHYVIEKSTDGKHYNQAGVVFTFENATSDVIYPYFEKAENNKTIETIYYRVSSVKSNGAIADTKTITVNMNKNFSNAIGATKNSSIVNKSVLSENKG